MLALKRHILLAFSVALFLSNVVSAQNNFGQPFVQNYSKNTYNAGTQNWSIKQSEQGLIYIANNDGLLEYDGSNWKTYKLPGQTICRSVFVDGKRVYVGGQGEFGFFEPNNLGELTFEKISAPKEFQATDVWKILNQERFVYFFSFEGLFQYDKASRQCQFYSPGSTCVFAGNYNGELLVQTKELGFYSFDGSQFYEEPALDTLKSFIVSALIQHSDSSYLITTLNNGIFNFNKEAVSVYHTNIDDYLKRNSIYCALKLQNGSLVCGTSHGGMAVLDKNKKNKLFMTKQNGLLNNNVLTVFEDREKNLWLGLDNGIGYVEINSAFKRIYPDGFLEGTSYAAELFDSSIYFGTNNGLYFSKWKRHQNPLSKELFISFDDLKGQVWGLKKLNNRLFVSHHTGLFYIQDSAVKKARQGTGSWLVQPLLNHPDRILEGTYDGIKIHQIINDTLILVNSIKGFNESSRFIAQDKKGFVWIAHPYKGVFRCAFNNELTEFTEIKKYNEENGFPSDVIKKVFELNNQIYFVAEKGVYQYNYDSDKMEMVNGINKFFGVESAIMFLSQGNSESIWFVDDKEVGRLKISYDGIEQDIKKVNYPEIKGMLVGGFEFASQIDSHFTLIGAEKGMILFDADYTDSNQIEVQEQITEVHLVLEKDSLLACRVFEIGDQETILTSGQNNLSFNFSAPIFNNVEKSKHSFILEGFDEAWSEWSVKDIKDYTNLPYGNYRFVVKAQLRNNSETQPAFFRFRILPPWYKSRVALIIMMLLFLGFLYSLIFFPYRKYKKQTKVLVIKQAEELEQKDIERDSIVRTNESEVMRLKNEKLLNEIKFKNQELASSTMHIVQKTEILDKIKAELQKAHEEMGSKTMVNGQIKKVLSLIRDNIRLDKNWDQFAHHFDQVHIDFNKRLKENHPELSANDLKLCAYLRMNLATKEIAPLLNISTRGVEISRYRLRKKLNLDRETHLSYFLSNI